jgi:hypothetical protein
MMAAICLFVRNIGLEEIVIGQENLHWGEMLSQPRVLPEQWEFAREKENKKSAYHWQVPDHLLDAVEGG